MAMKLPLVIDANGRIQQLQAGDSLPDCGMEVSFSFGDASPLSIDVVPTDRAIECVKLFIFTPFDGTGAALTVGDIMDPDGLMTAAQNNPAEAGSYIVAPGVSFDENTELLLTITPGAGAMQGNGLLVITFQR